MGDFERDTQLEGSAGKYRATLSPDWEIWGPNGGYVAAIALRAAGAEAKIARPASFSAHFLSVARFGSVDLEVTPLRLGRRSESFRVSMQQEGRLILEAIVRTAALGPGLEHDVAETPEVPEPENLKSTDELRDPEWLLADQQSPVAEAGLMGCNGRVWSRQGKLLASGGCQLMCIPAP